MKYIMKTKLLCIVCFWLLYANIPAVSEDNHKTVGNSEFWLTLPCDYLIDNTNYNELLLVGFGGRFVEIPGPNFPLFAEVSFAFNLKGNNNLPIKVDILAGTIVQICSTPFNSGIIVGVGPTYFGYKNMDSVKRNNYSPLGIQVTGGLFVEYARFHIDARFSPILTNSRPFYDGDKIVLGYKL